MIKSPFPCHEAIQLSGSPTHPSIVIAPAPFIEMDEAEHFVHQLEQTFHVRATELECGADRLQLSFSCGQHHYRMYYEQLSESMWIESSTGNPQEGIQALYQQLLLNQ